MGLLKKIGKLGGYFEKFSKRKIAHILEGMVVFGGGLLSVIYGIFPIGFPFG